jgi:hypothetical protein
MQQRTSTCGRNQVGLTTARMYIKLLLGNFLPIQDPRKRGGVDHTHVMAVSLAGNKYARIHFLLQPKISLEFSLNNSEK